MVKKLLKSGCKEHFQLLNEGEVSCKIIFLSPLCFRDPEFSICYSFSLSCKSSSPHKQKRRTMEILTRLRRDGSPKSRAHGQDRGELHYLSSQPSCGWPGSTGAFTSWQPPATFTFWKHGPAARQEISAL